MTTTFPAVTTARIATVVAEVAASVAPGVFGKVSVTSPAGTTVVVAVPA